MTKGVLALADGTIFRGEAFGAVKNSDSPTVSEVVFNTSMYGYQEILTDPSYAGQTITFTYPHIGNVGCNPEDIESRKIFASGVIVRKLSPTVSNFRATSSLSQFLEQRGVMGLSGIDTRALVTHIRDKGAQMGAMAGGDKVNVDTLIDHAKAAGSMLGKDYVHRVTCEKPYTWEETPWNLEENGYKKLSQERLSSRPHVVAVDCGIKYNILRLLIGIGFRVTVVPATHTTQEILALRPDALFLSNGPGDPATLDYVVSSVTGIIGKVPIFGICLGHQILAQALGAKTYKLKFGHRGGNHPVKYLPTGAVEITVQNHGFTVEENSLSKDTEITHINLNDGTIEGIEIPGIKSFGVQYHPESSPGPHDASYLFKKFYETVVS